MHLGALDDRANGRSGIADLRIVTFAPEQGEHVSVSFGESLAFVHVVANAGEALEIASDVGACLSALDAKLVGKAECRDAVDDAEIDRLGAAAHVGRHARNGNAEHLGSGHGVNVELPAESFAQSL